jgi:regulator of nucleoside diphosphate kinase
MTLFHESSRAFSGPYRAWCLCTGIAMSSLPTIILSTTDYDRLDALLSRPEIRALPGAERLRAEIERAELLEPEAMPADVVTMRSTLRCTDLTGNREMRFTLVYPDEADSEAGRISVLAPLGAALLGLSVGQEIDWALPSGIHRLRVEAIPYQPEAAGELHR